MADNLLGYIATPTRALNPHVRIVWRASPCVKGLARQTSTGVGVFDFLSDGTLDGMPALVKNRYSDMVSSNKILHLRSCACPRSTTPIIMRLCLAGGRAGRPSMYTVYIRTYVYTRIKYWRILIWRSVGRSAKAPNLIPRQIFRLYGITVSYVYS